MSLRQIRGIDPQEFNIALDWLSDEHPESFQPISDDHLPAMNHPWMVNLREIEELNAAYQQRTNNLVMIHNQVNVELIISRRLPYRLLWDNMHNGRGNWKRHYSKQTIIRLLQFLWPKDYQRVYDSYVRCSAYAGNYFLPAKWTRLPVCKDKVYIPGEYFRCPYYFRYSDGVLRYPQQPVYGKIASVKPGGYSVTVKGSARLQVYPAAVFPVTPLQSS